MLLEERTKLVYQVDLVGGILDLLGDLPSTRGR
jgi:hypothetical protein